MSKFKKIMKNGKVLILLAVILLAIFAISPAPWNDDLAIKSVVRNSTAAKGGILQPDQSVMPVNLERILDINGVTVESERGYHEILDAIPVNTTFIVTTNKNKYRLVTEPLYNITVLDELEEYEVIVQELNEDTNLTENVTKVLTRNKTITEVIGAKDIGLRLTPAATSNIRKGLDLSGGTRVLLKPQEAVSSEDMDLLLESMKQRLNVFGLSDVVIRTTNDLSGNVFILVEIAGANVDEVEELLGKQGKFEAKIGGQTVFIGGQDITYVCRTAECSGLDAQVGCQRDPSGTNFCGFRFSISLTQEAADRQAAITKDLPVELGDGVNSGGYLNESLELYLDGELMDTLRIGESLKGVAAKEISISGSGTGIDQREAVVNALADMKGLQTILITGSLPVKLDIVKTDSITPLLGKEFLDNVLLVGLAAILAVSLIIYIRYRRIAITIPVIITMLSEILILLGVAVLFRIQLELVAIAGILMAIGTGVDAQIVIADEILRKEAQSFSNWKDKIKNAFFIIMASYFTLVVAMIPLTSAGAGLLKGFALTTIIGATIGVFITRPAFAKIAEILLKE